MRIVASGIKSVEIERGEVESARNNVRKNQSFVAGGISYAEWGGKRKAEKNCPK